MVRLHILIALLASLAMRIAVCTSSQVPPAVANQLFGMLIGRSPYATSDAEYSRLTQAPMTEIHLSKASFGNELPSMLKKPFDETAKEEIAELDHDLEGIRNTKNAMLAEVERLKLAGTVPLLSKLHDAKKSGDLGIGSDAEENSLSMEEAMPSLLRPKQFIKPISNRRNVKEYLKHETFLTRYNPVYKTQEANPSHFEYLKHDKLRRRPSENIARMTLTGPIKQIMKDQMQPIMPERGDISPTNE